MSNLLALYWHILSVLPFYRICQYLLSRHSHHANSRHIFHFQHTEGGHGGGDDRMKQHIFLPNQSDPNRQAAGLRDGAFAILTGIAARNSIDSGKPVKIGDLTSLVPGAKKL